MKQKKLTNIYAGRELSLVLKKLDDENIAVVSHSSFLKQMLYGTIGDDSNQLNHCDPYKFDISK